MSSYSVTTQIHVWLGKTDQGREEFARYFTPNQPHAGFGPSQFAQDVNRTWYDDDLIGVYYNEADNRLETALDELPTSPSTIAQVRTRCAELGISEANALFYYEDAELTIAQPDKTYNDLPYLGCFDNT